LKTKIPDRFEIFGGVDWEKWVVYREEFPYWAAERLSFQASMGAKGLKIWKNFGLRVYDHLGNLVRVNDRRLDPIWNRARELNFPVMIHIADPVAFFEPLNEENERWEEMSDNPDWQFPEQKFPRFTNIFEDFANLIREHPKTMFIGAHVGCYAENLQWVSSLLNECPNFFVDISARIAELGRQPYAARRFFHDYSDRILFGSDLGPDIDSYRIMYRFLETDDEYFNYGTSEIPTQGRWNIYGIYLEDDFLRKIYRENAVKLLRATSETNNDELSKQL
jgi:predicted TIM-barrel fold metal-dependent hydrolase